jgi:EthD domain
MSIVCEIAIAAANSACFDADPLRHWRDLPELQALDLYTPAAVPGVDPYVDDGAAPAHLALLAFSSLGALDRAADHARFKTGLAALGTDILTCTAMRRSEHPVAGTDAPAPLSAQFSYVVRYHRPAEDETSFVQHYLDNHPPLLGRLPQIRNVLCYVPLPWRHPAGIPVADYMLGNEVVFDHHQHFSAAMASPLRHELRAHFRQFPPFSGRNTHYPMQRRRLWPDVSGRAG